MTETEKLNFLQDSIQQLFDRHLTVSLHDQLRDLGLDSLDVIELQLRYEEITGNIIPDTGVPVNTVRDLINLM
jgi:acyl carrier protein